MDRRKPLAFALSFLAGAAGCAHHSAATPAAIAKTPVETAVKPAAKELDPEALKRAPKPETFVAFGDFSAREADSATNPAEKEQLRDRARRAYQEALKADPNYLPAHKSLAHLYIALNDQDRAVATLESALKLAPNEANLWFELGMTHARGKQWGLALEHLSRAVELDPENRQFVKVQGFALARAGRYEESLAAFTRYEGEAKAHYYLAQMLDHLEQGDLCKTHLRLALAKDPQLEPAVQMLVRLSGDGPAPGLATPARQDAAVRPVGFVDGPVQETLRPASLPK